MSSFLKTPIIISMHTNYTIKVVVLVIHIQICSPKSELYTMISQSLSYYYYFRELRWNERNFIDKTKNYNGETTRLTPTQQICSPKSELWTMISQSPSYYTR